MSTFDKLLGMKKTSLYTDLDVDKDEKIILIR